MRRFAVGLAVAALLFLAAGPRATATPLPPGNAAAPNVISSVPAGVVLASQLQNLSGGPGSGLSATLYSTVWKETGSGHLDFLYQIVNTGPSGGQTISSFNIGSFSGFSTDVSNLAPSAASPGGQLSGAVFNPGGTIQSDLARRNGGPAKDRTLLWDGGGFFVQPGQGSYILAVRTNATSFNPDGTAVLIGETAILRGSVYQPTGQVAQIPEPASLLLLGGCVLGLGGSAAVRRWRARK
jgi:hypothetical protein